jgi:hypothetical protein
MEQTDAVHPGHNTTTAESKHSSKDGVDEQSSRGTSNNRNPMKSEHGLNRGPAQPQKRKNETYSNVHKKKKFGRNWDGPTRRERNVDSRPELQENGEKEERRPKKKVACFIGYSGEGYHGMQ